MHINLDLLKLVSRPLLTTKDLALHFGVTPQTIRKWRRKGEMPRPIIIPSGPRWTVESITLWEKTSQK